MLLRELARLPKSKKEAAVTQIVQRSRGPANGQLEGVRAAIGELERKHGMSTEQMIAGVKAGMVPDDFEFVEWLMLARLTRG